MEDPRIISTQFNSPKMPYYNVLVNNILRPATTVEGMEIITREVLDDLLESAEKLIDKMRCANYA